MEDTEFIRALRSALNSLYEPDQLRGNPLVGVLGLEGRVDAPALLQEIIRKSIDAIRESADEVNYTRSWLAHDVLYLRYVRGYAREEAARKLNISDRQFSREVRTAIETLGMVIWRNHSALAESDVKSETTPHSDSSTDAAEPLHDSVVDAPMADGDVTEEDAGWLQDMPEDHPADWREILSSVLGLLQPVMAQHQTQLRVDMDRSLPNLLVAQNTLRHSLLVLLGWLIPVGAGATILLTPDVDGDKLALRWTVRLAPATGDSLREVVAEPLEISRQLLEQRGGSLEVTKGESDDGTLSALLTIPSLARVPVLVIDDNLDTIQLFQRYVQGTRYALMGVSTPDDVPRALERVQPRVILLDVMMPEIDGWDMLARLRHSSVVQNCSILVCSIMPLESVAHSLGADGFLQKPLLPQQLLYALDAQMERATS